MSKCNNKHIAKEMPRDRETEQKETDRNDKEKNIEREKRQQLHVNEQLCAFINGQQPKYFTSIRNVNSTHVLQHALHSKKQNA